MIRMDGDEGKGVSHFPTSLWWSGNAVCLPASYDATGVYFRQPQSEEPVLQSLMMRGGDRAVLWQVSGCVCALVFLPCACAREITACVCVCVRCSNKSCALVSPRHSGGCAGRRKGSPGCLYPRSGWPRPPAIDCALSTGGKGRR